MKLYKRRDFIYEKTLSGLIIINHLNGTIISLNHTAATIWGWLKLPTPIIKLEKKFVDEYGSENVYDFREAISTIMNLELVETI